MPAKKEPFKYVITTILTLLTPLLIALVVYSAGGGHGSYFPSLVLFPSGCVSFSLFGEVTVPFIFAALLQFPIYGIIIDKSRKKLLAFVAVVVYHIGLIVLISPSVMNVVQR